MADSGRSDAPLVTRIGCEHACLPLRQMVAGSKRKRPALSRRPLIQAVVAGAGFEPATFGL